MLPYLQVSDTSASFNSTLNSTQVSLNVQQSLTKLPSEIKANHCQEVKKCCCAGQGMINIKAWIQKDSYMAGETACIVLEVQNDSDADFSQVRGRQLAGS